MAIVGQISIDSNIYDAGSSDGYLYSIDNMRLHARFGRRSDGKAWIAIGTDREHYVAFGLQWTGSISREQSGNSITFHLGTLLDFVWTVDENVIKEDIIIHSRPPVNTLTFDYLLTGIRAENEPDKVRFYNSDTDHLLFEMDKPDVAIDNDGNTAPISFGLDNQAGTFSMSLPGAALDAAVYPVVIDPTVATTTDVDGLWDGGKHFCHYANGYYWVAFHDGTEPVIYSSSDKTTWASQGNVFTTPQPFPGHWNIYWSGTTAYCFCNYYSGGDQTYYRSYTLNNDGTIAAADAETTTVDVNQDTSDSTTDNSAGYLDSANNPVSVSAYKAGSSSIVGVRKSGGSWQAISSGTVYRNFNVLPIPLSSQKVVVLMESRSGSYTPRSIYGDFSIATETYQSEQLLSTNQNVGARGRELTALLTSAIHCFYVDTNDDIRHEERDTGSADTWTDNGAVFAGTVTRVTCAKDGTDIYLVYDKNDNKLYYRKYDGSWGSEQNLKTDATALQSSISCYHQKENNEIGVCWIEGAGSPYDVVFDTISVAAPAGVMAAHYYRTLLQGDRV